jgi:hypothetical protein
VLSVRTAPGRVPEKARRSDLLIAAPHWASRLKSVHQEDSRVRLRAYHLPGIEALKHDLLRRGALQVEVPQLQPAQLCAAMAGAREAALRQLRTRSVDDLLATVDRIIAAWLHPHSAVRQQAEAVLPDVTGFSGAMVRHGLPLLLNELRAENLGALLDAELGDRRVLDDMPAGKHAAAPPLIAHVMSGNIPGLAAAPVLLSVVLKSAVLVKAAAGDPVFPALLAESIGEVDAEMARCVLVTYWRGGDQKIETAALGSADLVVASGSDAAIAALASRAPRRFIGHGHKVSFAAVCNECLHDHESAEEMARRLAYDVSLWDQQGCLSPQLCYVESRGAVTPHAFASHLAQALSDYAVTLPPRQHSFDEDAEILRFRQQAEWHPAHAALASSGSSNWSISIEEDAEFLPTCLNRCIRIKVVSDLSQLVPALAPHRRHLEAAGLAAPAARAQEISSMLARCGVHRICAIGEMQRPPLSWRQGGRPRIADWVEWTMVEESQDVKE